MHSGLYLLKEVFIALPYLLTIAPLLKLLGIKGKNELLEKFGATMLGTGGIMDTPVAIVTGSNTGVGKETAGQLYQRGAVIVLACRDVNKGNEAKAAILAAYPRPGATKPQEELDRIVVMKLDLNSLQSVFDFVVEFKKSFTRLDILVNNAGLNTEGKTKDGLQQLFQVNYLGHYLLVRLLFGMFSYATDIGFNSKHQADIDVLCGPFDNKSARIVNLSSVAHHQGNEDYISSSLPRSHCANAADRDGKTYYGDSKFYMNLLTYEINKRYSKIGFDENSTSNTDVPASPKREARSVAGIASPLLKTKSLLAVAANPGAVRSDIWRSMNRIVLTVYDVLMKFIFLSPVQGASTSVYGGILPTEYIISHCNQLLNRERANTSISSSAKTLECGLIPYLAPYNQPWKAIGFELLGDFAGPVFVPCSQPANIESVASELWKFSAQLCNEKLQHSGVKEIQFLD